MDRGSVCLYAPLLVIVRCIVFCLELDPIIIKRFNRVGRTRGAYSAIKKVHRIAQLVMEKKRFLFTYAISK